MCKTGFFDQHNDLQYRNSEKCVRLCRTIARDFQDILSPKGFIKCGVTYLRQYGNALLQYITVSFNKASWHVEIQIGVVPLYQCPVGFWRRWLSGIRTVSGLGGYPMCRITGTEEKVSVFCYSADYASAVADDKDTLIKCILPRLDEIRNATDVLHFIKFDPMTMPVFPNIALLLRAQKYTIVAKCLEKEIEKIEEHQKTVQHLFADGTINNAAVEYHRKFDEERLSFCQRLLSAVIHNDQECINLEFETAINAAYKELEIYSKAFVARYPQKVLHWTE